MDQPFESDVMDDLAAETPLSSTRDLYDNYEDTEDEYDGEDSFAEGLDDYGDSRDHLSDLDHSFDQAIHQELSTGAQTRGAVRSLPNALEAAIAAALSAPSTDTFLRRLSQGLQEIASEPIPARKNGQRSTHRKTSPKSTIASGRAITPVANLAAQLARSRAEPQDALEAFLDLADAEPDNPSVAPVIAGLSLHSTLADHLGGTRTQRQRLVHSVSQATQTIAQHHGSQAMAAMPRILDVVQRNASAQQIPPSELPGAIQRITRQVAANDDLVHRLAQTTLPPASAPTKQRVTVTKGTVQRLVFDRPVELTIRYL
ncbi:hypothetical protein [Nodosilinea sp. FACHB-13]|uniref:hypothetical protein n=1 Tax=Cyanophyceae TaxID=3028117 RepID=UPI001683D5AF|nr:hypothetical protein [Nodosilinea sp. FACHB-13]MBD2108956.1 hypothetical protein [Nodosilinea sp. FACHB-13]